MGILHQFIIFRTSINNYVSIYLVSEESLCENEFFWCIKLPGNNDININYTYHLLDSKILNLNLNMGTYFKFSDLKIQNCQFYQTLNR